MRIRRSIFEIRASPDMSVHIERGVQPSYQRNLRYVSPVPQTLTENQ